MPPNIIDCLIRIVTTLLEYFTFRLFKFEGTFEWQGSVQSGYEYIVTPS